MHLPPMIPLRGCGPFPSPPHLFLPPSIPTRPSFLGTHFLQTPFHKRGHFMLPKSVSRPLFHPFHRTGLIFFAQAELYPSERAAAYLPKFRDSPSPSDGPSDCDGLSGRTNAPAIQPARSTAAAAARFKKCLKIAFFPK